VDESARRPYIDPGQGSLLGGWRMTVEQLGVLGVLLVPLAAAVVVWCLGPARGPAIRAVSVAASVVTIVLALYLAGAFMALERGSAGQSATFVPEFVPGSSAEAPHQTTWTVLGIGPGPIQFFVGIDGLNIWLVVLTALLMLPCVLVSFEQVTERVNEFYAWLLALQTTMIGVFLAFDVILFYVFFELTLVPLFFLIGIWGGAQRQYAARKFFIYTLTGSLITLLGVLGAVIACYTQTGTLTFAIPELVSRINNELANPASREFWRSVQLWVFAAMSVGFAVKVPLLPLHTWLPLAHTEAPTAGSVDLAGVLLKLGCYGFLRLCIPLAPDASLSLGLPLITWLGVLGIIYGAACAFAQDDVKKLIAYSSVSHLGVVMLGMFSLNATGLQGSLMQMINHGLSTPLLFLLIGMLYERYHTRKLEQYGGIASKMPLFGTFLVFSCLSSVGLPGLNGFVGELLCLAGIYQYEGSPYWGRMILTALGTTGMLLGAWYLFTMLRRLLFGPLREPAHEGHAVHDLTPREWALLAPLLLLCVVLGLYPTPVLKTAAPDVDRIAKITAGARERAGLPAPARAEVRERKE
jgi:NADH-quinone oxidoreductase subunit M